MTRSVYIAESFHAPSGTTSELGFFGTRARARRAVREAGFTRRQPDTGRVEYWHRPEDAGNEYPDEHATISRRAVQ